MTYQDIRFEIADGVARLTLQRPEALNAIHTAMSKEIRDALQRARVPEVRAVYLTGSGRAFCAGQDLAEVTPGGPIQDFAYHHRTVWAPLVLAIRELDKPVVCGVNGVAAGAGANLALACDLVVAASEASFVQAFSKIGLVPDTGGTWMLPRLVGPARAMALTLLGERLSAEDAVRIGLIYQSCPGAELETVAYGLARRLATQPTIGLGLTKRALAAAWSNTLERQLEVESEYQGIAGRTADYREGVAAFQAKRPPQFRGT